MRSFLIFFHAGWQEEGEEKAEGTRITSSPKAVHFLALESLQSSRKTSIQGRKTAGLFLLRVKTCAAGKAVEAISSAGLQRQRAPMRLSQARWATGLGASPYPPSKRTGWGGHSAPEGLLSAPC